MEKKLLIIEGPAGAGKSTLISELTTLGLVLAKPALPLERPRGYETDDSGAGLSQLKDSLTLMSVLHSPETNFVADRGFISQQVYNTIRNRRKQKPHDFESGMLKVPEQIKRLVLALHQDYTLRQNEWEASWEWSLQVHILFYIPDPIQIRMRRAIAGKYYPYPVEEEVYLYQTAHHLIHRTQSNLKIKYSHEPGPLVDYARGVIA